MKVSEKTAFTTPEEISSTANHFGYPGVAGKEGSVNVILAQPIAKRISQLIDASEVGAGLMTTQLNSLRRRVFRSPNRPQSLKRILGSILNTPGSVTDPHLRDLLKSQLNLLGVHDLYAFDKKTQLHNEPAFETALQLWLARHNTSDVRKGERRELPEGADFIFLDLNNFKKLNDTFGHDAGDDALKLFAKTLREYAQKYKGLSCRKGGDEFLLFLPHSQEYTDHEDGFTRKWSQDRKKFDDKKFSNLSASLGIEVISSQGINDLSADFETNYSVFRKAADKKMYQNKKAPASARA